MRTIHLNFDVEGLSSDMAICGISAKLLVNRKSTVLLHPSISSIKENHFSISITIRCCSAKGGIGNRKERNVSNPTVFCAVPVFFSNPID